MDRKNTTTEARSRAGQHPPRALLSLGAAGLLLAVAGCGAPGGRGEDGWDEGSEGSLIEALSTNESCDTATANRSTNHWPGDFKTPASYGSRACASAYIIDANLYQGYDFTSDPREVHWFGYGGSLPQSCGRIRFGIYVWRDGIFEGSTWRWGKAMTIGDAHSSCDAAVAPVPHFDLEDAAIYSDRVSVGHDYRFAITARLHDTANNAGSHYVTTPISSFTVPRGEADDF